MHAVDREARDLLAADRPVAVLDEIPQPRLEPLARFVMEVEHGQLAADRTAEQERRVPERGEIEQSADRAAALGEWHSVCH